MDTLQYTMMPLLAFNSGEVGRLLHLPTFGPSHVEGRLPEPGVSGRS